MTNEQRSQITALHTQGNGYRKISALTGIPENTVKSFCRRLTAGTDSRPSAGRKVQPLQSSDSACPLCGKPIIRTEKRKPRKFCSDRCRNLWWNAHQNLVKRKAVYSFSCGYCGKSFSAYGNAHRKYCSVKCSTAARTGGER